MYFDLLNYYQMLIDLEKLDAIDNEYVNLRLRRFCIYLKQGSGPFTINEYVKDKIVSRALADRLSVTCGVKL